MQTSYVRPYTQPDLPGVAEINQRLDILPFSQEWALGHYLSSLQTGGGGCFVVENDGKRLAAFGLLRPLPGRPHAFSLHMGVDLAYRGSGVGKALLETLKQVAVHRDAAELVIVLPREDLEISRFVEAAGFILRNYTWQLILPSQALANIQPEPLPKNFKLTSLAGEQKVEFDHLCRAALSDKPRFERYSQLTLSEVTNQQNYQSGDVMILRLDRGDNGKDEAIGLAVLQLTENMAQVEPLGVFPTWREQGLERILLKTALVRARERGASESEIWVHSADSLMLDICSNVGFERVGTRLTYICKLGTS